MNIKITHNWLLEFLDTQATPQEIQKYLSLCGPSVDSVEKQGNDYIYDIEITSNRIDTASVVGIAREACTILNRFGIKSQLKNIPVPSQKSNTNKLPLLISDSNKLCHRVASVVMENILVKKTPAYIKNRLEAVGIRSLNNIIDITNYVMIEYGHPTHVMDYDRIGTAKLIIRNAINGEFSTTLDGKKHDLSEKDVVADDGTGRIVDLLGIMGCENSVVTNDTKRVILFIESNNPHIIRHTSMRLGIRTVAATYDEKQVDSELTITALNRLIQLFEEIADAKVASQIIDIYHTPKKSKYVSIKYQDIERLIGITIPKKECVSILQNLGFMLHKDEDNLLTFQVPSYRSHDVSIKEDLIEEIARIYGYFKLPNNLQPMTYVKRSKSMEDLFSFQNKIKLHLKHLGLHEVLNYSMISQKQIKNLNLQEKDHLYLSNTLSEDIKYLRITLIPSLLKNVKDNQGRKDQLQFFEIAKIYPIRNNELPDEKFVLSIIVNTSFSDLKGITKSLFNELNIENVKYSKSSINYLTTNIQSILEINSKEIGYIGMINQQCLLQNEINNNVFVAEFTFQSLIDNSKSFPRFNPLSSYAIIKLDATISSQTHTYQEIEHISFSNSKLLTKLEFISQFNNNITLRFHFGSNKENITEDIAKHELKKILSLIS